jgi:hypothetical protein
MKKIILLSVLILCSCGSKKKTVFKQEEVLQLNQEGFIKVDSEKINDIEMQSNVKKSISKTATSTKSTYTPIDATKPASVIDKLGNKKTLNNASLVIEETNGYSKEDEQALTAKSDHSRKKNKSEGGVNLNIDASTSSSAMNLDKKGTPDWWRLYILCFLIIGGAAYYLYNKFNIKKYVTDFIKK